MTKFDRFHREGLAKHAKLLGENNHVIHVFTSKDMKNITLCIFSILYCLLPGRATKMTTV